MLTKPCVLDQISFEYAAGGVNVRLDKRWVFEGEVMKSEPHRFAITPETDLEATMLAVDEHLVAMGYEGFAEQDRQKVRDAWALFQGIGA